MADLPTVLPLRDLFDAAVRHPGVKLTCRRCGHARILSAPGLWWLFNRKGWRDDLRDVQRRYFCLMCWHSGGHRIHFPELELVDEEPTDSSLPLPSPLDWKRELRRRR